ncbi:MAG: hypothetical protein Ta2B_30320 [Termitinemataceae bacterium]|nr:MAG: hypothetical protein Ta2B_30320 [Termitinemataceae bacterium]
MRADFAGADGADNGSVEKAIKVNVAISQIVNGKDEATVKNLRPDLMKYGGNSDVTFIWGNENKGLYHIGYRRGADTVKNVIRTVTEGNISRVSSAKKTVTLEFKGYEAVLSLDENGKNKTWLLTGWQKNVPDAIGEVSTQSEATQKSPTFSRANLGAGTPSLSTQSTEKSSGGDNFGGATKNNGKFNTE